MVAPRGADTTGSGAALKDRIRTRGGAGPGLCSEGVESWISVEAAACTLNHGADGQRPVVATFLAGPGDPAPTSPRAPECAGRCPRWARNGHARSRGKDSAARNYLERVVGRDGIEPPTPGFSGLGPGSRKCAEGLTAQGQTG